ncbi:MAG: sacsin N-terminal ATP-binding-like domain-containing protein, partial [Candidatus Helarchaeota archaeon]
MEDLLKKWSNKSEEEKKKIIQEDFINLKYDVKKYLENRPSDFTLLIDLYRGMESIIDNSQPYTIGKIIELTSEINRLLINHPDSNKKTKFFKNLNSFKQEIPEFIRFLFCNMDDNLINKPEYLSLLFKASNSLFDSTILENALKISTEQYSDEWHFFFELIQNSRDARSKNISMEKLKFNEERSFLIYANNGDKFNPMDVWGIVSLGQGAKNRAKTIGYFGIGFKSVRLVTDSVIIISDPIQFRLNFNYGETRKKYIEWKFEGDFCWNFIKNSKILLKYNDFTNIFILENIDNSKFEEFFKYTENIDPNFMLFLTPLRKASIFKKTLESEIITDFFNLSDKEYKDALYDTQIVKIGNTTYIIHNLFEDLNLKDDNNREIGKREVKIAFKIKKISDNIFQIEKHESKFDLYAYFPISNNNPGFNFIFHGHFLLTNSRSELILNAKQDWKNELNDILIKDKGAKCFLELYSQLANLKFLVKGLSKIFPFQEISKEKKQNEIYIYKTFQEGLKEYLQDKYKEIPFWWDEDYSKYIRFADVIFIEDAQASKILKFLRKNLKTLFNSLLNDFSELELNSDVYICDEKDKINYCSSVFNDFSKRRFDSDKCFEFIKMILKKLDPDINSEFVPISEWEGYFGSSGLLEEFRKFLKDWTYIKKAPKSKISELFQFFLIILEDCSGVQYYARVRYKNYFYIEQELFQKYGEIIEILQEIESLREKELIFPDVELPLFIPEQYENEYKDEDNLFYRCESFNVYSILDIDNFNNIVIKNEAVFNLFLTLIERIFQDSLEKINSKENKGFNELFELISGKDSRNYREPKIFHELILKLLNLPIFKGIREPDCFFNLIWGDPEYLKLFTKTPISNMFNIINPRLYDFSKLILEIINKYIIYREFKNYRNKINQYNLSYKSIKNNIDDIKNLVNNKNIDELRANFDQNNYFISFFTDDIIFDDFFQQFYLNDSTIGNLREIIHLSKIYDPPRFQILKIRDDFKYFPIIELQEDISELEYELIKDLFNLIKGKKYNWIHREDLIKFKEKSNIKIKKKLILDLIKSIIKKLNKLEYENESHWRRFYKLLLKYFNRLETKQQENFRNQYKDFCIKENLSHKIINNEGDLIETKEIFPDNIFENQNYLIKQIASYPNFQKYRLKSNQKDLWNDLENSGLIFQKMDLKTFLKKILNSINNLETFYENLEPKSKNGNNLSFIQFYEQFLLILKNSGLRINDLKNYKLIPTLTFEFLRVNELPQAINFLYYDDGLEEYPFREINKEFTNFQQLSELIQNWIAPAYFKIFENIFGENSLKKSKKPLSINDWFLEPNLKNEINIKELPIFLNLKLLEYYFKYKKRFEIKSDLQILKNALSFLSLHGIEKNIFINFIDYLKELKSKEGSNIINEFKNILSEFEIYPYNKEGKWVLTNLKNPKLNCSENQIPDFFSNVIKESDFIYLHPEIEDLLKESKLQFDFLKHEKPINLSLIIEKFQHLFDPKNDEFDVEQHKKLVNYLFQSNNFNFYNSKEEKSNLKEILKMLYLKGYNEKYQLSSNLYHPNFFKK